MHACLILPGSSIGVRGVSAYRSMYFQTGRFCNPPSPSPSVCGWRFNFVSIHLA